MSTIIGLNDEAMSRITFPIVRQATTAMLALVAAVATAQENSKPVERVHIEEFARFEGGVERFYAYVQENLKYPASALRDSLSGVVYVEFMLGKDGAIDKASIKVVQSLSPECDKEAVRLITEAPPWMPARSRNEAAVQSVIFPVSFGLQDE